MTITGNGLRAGKGRGREGSGQAIAIMVTMKQEPNPWCLVKRQKRTAPGTVICGDKFWESKNAAALKCANELGGEVTRAKPIMEKTRVKQKKRKQ